MGPGQARRAWLVRGSYTKRPDAAPRETRKSPRWLAPGGGRIPVASTAALSGAYVCGKRVARIETASHAECASMGRDEKANLKNCVQFSNFRAKLPIGSQYAICVARNSDKSCHIIDT